jgi:3',5'-cyclic AMP phosphodiesterase CpdA
MLNILDTTIKIPHLKKPITLLHITDLHITRADERDNEYVHWLSADRKRYFPHSEDIFNDLRQFIHHNRPDYTVLTGDIIDFPSEKNLDTLIDFLHDDCKSYLYTLGNHDWCYPIESPTEETKNKYYPRFHSVTNGTPDFQVIDAGGVLLIGIDNTTNQITASQLDKLKTEFEKAIPCVLFFHVPLYIDTLLPPVVSVWGQPIMIGTPQKAFSGELSANLVPTDETAEFCRLIEKNDTPVAAVVCGHVHFSHEDTFAENRTQFITPLCSTLENANGTIRRITIKNQE